MSAHLSTSIATVTEAARSSLGHPLRAALGSLAIAVAVGTIAVVVSGLDGFVRYARQTTARAFGSDTFVLSRVSTVGTTRTELADKLARNPAIGRSDVRFLDRYSNGEVLYAPIVQRRADATAGGRAFENAAVSGTASALFEIRDLGLSRGRFIRGDDEARAAQVAVVGAEVADALFPAQDPIGGRIRIAGRGFEVIGLQARQGTAGGTSLDRSIWIPLQAYERVFGATDSLQVFARAATSGQTAPAEDRVRVTMRARRQLQPGRPDTFDILSPEAARGFVERISERIGSAAVPISIMALLAAIVVVTNTTLVSVTQRTREIGVRRALGATRRHITAEVLAESSLIALLGGAAGVAGAAGLLAIVASLIQFDLPLHPSTAAWSLGAAVTSGLVAGWYPARRAIHIDPIAAIRQD